MDVALAKLDQNDSLDAFTVNWAASGKWPKANRLWLNDGIGTFTDSGLSLGDGATRSVALGDLDGDGDLDAFTANFGANEVWFNGNRAYFDVGRQQNDLGQDVYYSSNDETTLPVLLQQPATQPVTVHVGIESSSQTLTETMLFEVAQQLMMLNLVSSAPDPSEEYLLTLYLTSGSESPAPENQTDRLSLFFVDQVQGPQECLLCFNE